MAQHLPFEDCPIDTDLVINQNFDLDDLDLRTPSLSPTFMCNHLENSSSALKESLPVNDNRLQSPRSLVLLSMSPPPVCMIRPAGREGTNSPNSDDEHVDITPSTIPVNASVGPIKPDIFSEYKDEIEYLI